MSSHAWKAVTCMADDMPHVLLCFVTAGSKETGCACIDDHMIRFALWCKGSYLAKKDRTARTSQSAVKLVCSKVAQHVQIADRSEDKPCYLILNTDWFRNTVLANMVCLLVASSIHWLAGMVMLQLLLLLLPYGCLHDCLPSHVPKPNKLFRMQAALGHLAQNLSL